MAEESCPGRERCHGCLCWCDWCGDVKATCDYPECDQHKRPPEIEAEISALRAEVQELLRKAWEFEKRGPGPTEEDASWFRSRARATRRELEDMDREEDELQELHLLAVHERANGRLVDRPVPPPTDQETGQLSLPF